MEGKSLSASRIGKSTPWSIRLSIAMVVLLAVATGATAYPQVVGLHRQAPALDLSPLIGGPRGMDLRELRGKVVVLEFWATWCAPCIAEIQSINALVRASDSHEVQIISITDEDPETVKKFVLSHPIDGWIGIDQSSKVFDRYGITTRPTTIIIGPDGRVVSNNIHPHQLSYSQLLQIARQKTTTLSAIKSPAAESHFETAAKSAEALQIQRAAGSGDSADLLFEVNLTKGDGVSFSHLYQHAPGVFDLTNASVSTLLQLALGYDEQRITLASDFHNEARYNLSVKASDLSMPEFHRLIESALASALHARIEHHVKQENALVLTSTSPTPSGTQTAKPDVAFYNPQKTSFVMLHASSRWIAIAAEDATSLPVIDQVGTAVCDGQFALAKGDVRSLRSELEQRCGLTLVSQPEMIDRITVRPISSSSEHHGGAE